MNHILFNLYFNFHFGTELLTYQSKPNGVVGGALGWNASLKYQKSFWSFIISFLIYQKLISDFSQHNFWNTINCNFACFSYFCLTISQTSKHLFTSHSFFLRMTHFFHSFNNSFNLEKGIQNDQWSKTCLNCPN